MSEDLLRIISAELHEVSAGTADCPNLIHRVTIGVRIRRARQRRLAVALVTLAIAIAAPLLRSSALDPGGHDQAAARSVKDGCAAATDAPGCERLLSSRAQQALLRANPPALLVEASAINVSPLSTCRHRPSCPV